MGREFGNVHVFVAGCVGDSVDADVGHSTGISFVIVALFGHIPIQISGLLAFLRFLLAFTA